jgi:hypothetical protein
MTGKNKIFLYFWKNEHRRRAERRIVHLSRTESFTKERLSVMADAVEAGLAVSEYTGRNISTGRQDYRIKVTEGYFKECPYHFQGYWHCVSVFKEN